MRVRQVIHVDGQEYDVSTMTVAELEDAGEIIGRPWALLDPAGSIVDLFAMVAVLRRRDLGEDDTAAWVAAHSIGLANVDVHLHVDAQPTEPQEAEHVDVH